MDGTVEERTHNYPLTVCPHCEREVPGNMADMHATVCAHRPELKARIEAALTSDVPGVGVRIRDYERAYKTLGLPPVSTLLRNYGGMWPAVLEAFGLTVQGKAPKRMTARQREAAACADVAQMCEDTRRIVAAEYEAAHTLKACSVRDLPGVTVNGHKCVAVMLR
jgi:hypothetical protein